MRLALAALASTGAGMPASSSANPPTCEAPASQIDGLRKAFYFAYPLYEMTRMRQVMLSAPEAKPNSLRHRRTLSRPSDRSITTPNVDTLYSTAWLDLSSGPVKFSIPAMGRRYHSAELMHAFSDAFAMLSNESDSTRTYLIVGPDWDGEAPAGLTVVRSPTRDAWLVIRTFVNGPADLAEARGVQASYSLSTTAPSAEAPSAEASIALEPNAVQFLSVVNSALARGPLPPEQQSRIACFTDAGIGSTGVGGTETLDPSVLAVWETNIASFYRQTQVAFDNVGILHDGWRYPAPNIAIFGTDDVYRSAMALGGLAAMPIAEAVNPIAVSDVEGKALTGLSRYRLRIPAAVPVDGFWSLTLYQSGDAGRWFLHDNSIDRYAINSATTGLLREPDGSLVVDLSHDKPEQASNWLPAPQGRFMVVFRGYRPYRSFIDGSFRLPPISRVAQ